MHFFALCTRECTSVQKVHGYGEDNRIESVKPETLREGLCPIFGDYDSSRNRIKTAESESCVYKEQRLHATHEFGAEKMMMSHFVRIRGEEDEEKKVTVKKVLLLFCCVVGG